ncbi:MAG: zinc ribbon domain-containing protein [bacterium]
MGIKMYETEDEHLHKGIDYFDRGRYQEAEQMLRLSLKERPRGHDSLDRLFFLARILLAEGKLAMVERIARRLAREADDSESRWFYASILYQREKFAEAETLFREVVQESPAYGLGGILERVALRKRWKEEGFLFKPDPARCLEAFLLNLQHQGYLNMKIYREAQFVIEQALELDPDNCLLHQRRAEFEWWRPHFCPSCGEPVHPGWRRCTVCAADLSYRSPDVWRDCPYCGAEVGLLWNSCSYCGRDPDQAWLIGSEEQEAE